MEIRSSSFSPPSSRSADSTRKNSPSPTSVATQAKGGRIVSVEERSIDRGVSTRKLSAADFLEQAAEAQKTAAVVKAFPLKSRSSDTTSTSSTASSSSKSKK